MSMQLMICVVICIFTAIGFVSNRNFYRKCSSSILYHGSNRTGNLQRDWYQHQQSYILRWSYLYCSLWYHPGRRHSGNVF